jgi:hypothetical protein
MSTICDDPCSQPTDDEENIFAQYVLPSFMDNMIRRFGRERTEVIFDYWHISHIAEALTNGWERGKRRRFLSDLNEELRDEQYINHMEWHGDEKGFRPLLLIRHASRDTCLSRK